MKIVKRLAISLVCCSLSAAQLACAAPDQTIIYKNQRGSTMTLVFHSGEGNTGTLEGTFTTAVGECKADVGVPLPLTGYFNGNAAGITFNFPHCKQVVAMTGNLMNDRSKLHTLWLDAAPVDDSRGKDWNSNIVGSDAYDRVD